MAERALPPAPLRAGLRGATALARGLGPLRYAVADGVALGLWAAQPQRRRRAAENHRRSDPSIDEREARRRARRSYREYGRTTVDFLWANAMDPDRVRSNTILRGFEHVDACRARGRGGVLALSHFGNWDMAANIALSRGMQLTTVMAPVGPRAITGLVIWARERNQMEVYTPESAVRGLLRTLRANRFVALLCDISGGGPTVVVRYCGGPVLFSAVPAWLARRTGADLLPVDCWRTERGYEALVHPAVSLEGDDTAVMQRVATELEQAVRRTPAQWYPFGKVYAGDGAAG